MKRLLLLMFLLKFVSVCHSQTAREYFNELKDANAFKHYADEYVCFPDEPDAVNFAVVSTGSSLAKRSPEIAKSNKTQAKNVKDYLFVNTFYKGVSSGIQPYEQLTTDREGEYSIEFKSPMHGRMTYLINWTTGRYRLQVFALEKSRNVPAEERSGKCELIHPGIQ